MSRKSPLDLDLTHHERRVLESRARKHTSPYFEVLRARMILLAAQGWRNDEIAAALSVGRDVVSLWRKRFFHQRLAGAGGETTFGSAPNLPGFQRYYQTIASPFEWKFTRTDLCQLMKKLAVQPTH